MRGSVRLRIPTSLVLAAPVPRDNRILSGCDFLHYLRHRPLTCVSAVPRFDRFTWIWGIIASIAAVLMLIVEADYLIYSIQHLHHWKTELISLAYVAFVYIWWCCSLAHGTSHTTSCELQNHDGGVCL